MKAKLQIEALERRELPSNLPLAVMRAPEASQVHYQTQQPTQTMMISLGLGNTVLLGHGGVHVNHNQTLATGGKIGHAGRSAVPRMRQGRKRKV